MRCFIRTRAGSGRPRQVKSDPLGLTGDYKFNNKNLTIRFGKPFKVSDMSIQEADEKLFNEVKKLMEINLNILKEGTTIEEIYIKGE